MDFENETSMKSKSYIRPLAICWWLAYFHHFFVDTEKVVLLIRQLMQTKDDPLHITRYDINQKNILWLIKKDTENACLWMIFQLQIGMTLPLPQARKREEEKEEWKNELSPNSTFQITNVST